MMQTFTVWASADKLPLIRGIVEETGLELEPQNTDELSDALRGHVDFADRCSTGIFVPKGPVGLLSRRGL